MYKVWTKFDQNRIKDVVSRVFTKMLQKDWQNEGQTDSIITIDWLIDWLIDWSISPLTSFNYYKTGCTRFAAACDKVYQLLAHGRWFSPGTLASSTTKTGDSIITIDWLIDWLIFGVLTPLSTIFQLHHGDQF
jgi:hypothetical protein